MAREDPNSERVLHILASRNHISKSLIELGEIMERRVSLNVSIENFRLKMNTRTKLKSTIGSLSCERVRYVHGWKSF